MNENKRDFREETNLNAAEFALLKELAGELGLSKSAALRYCLHEIGDKVIRSKHVRDTGIVSGD